MHAEPVKIRCKASWDMKLMVSGISSRFWDDFFHIQACNRLDWCVVDIFSFIVLGANHDMCTDGGIQGRKSWFGQLFRLVGWEQRQMDVLLSIELRAAFLRVICLLNFRRCLSGALITREWKSKYYIGISSSFAWVGIVRQHSKHHASIFDIFSPSHTRSVMARRFLVFYFLLKTRPWSDQVFKSGLLRGNRRVFSDILTTHHLERSLKLKRPTLLDEPNVRRFSKHASFCRRFFLFGHEMDNNISYTKAIITVDDWGISFAWRVAQRGSFSTHKSVARVSINGKKSVRCLSNICCWFVWNEGA